MSLLSHYKTTGEPELPVSVQKRFRQTRCVAASVIATTVNALTLAPLTHLKAA